MLDVLGVNADGSEEVIRLVNGFTLGGDGEEQVTEFISEWKSVKSRGRRWGNYSPGVLNEALSGFVVVIIVILESSEITGVILQSIVSECRGEKGTGERT